MQTTLQLFSVGGQMTPRRYLRNLRRHPGLGFATFLTFVGAVSSRGSTRVAIINALFMSIFWIPILVTSRHNYDKDDHE